MRLSGNALTFATVALPVAVLSQLITVTEYQSICKASHTAGADTTPVDESTVIFSPWRLPDAFVNAGVPFLLQIQHSESASERRQAEEATYLASHGRTTTNPSQAGQYRIDNGALVDISGQLFSTDGEVGNMLVAPSSRQDSIYKVFYAYDGALHWDNDAFDGGVARFFTFAKVGNAQQAIVRFSGPTNPNWLPVTFNFISPGSVGIETVWLTAPTSMLAKITWASTKNSHTLAPTPSRNVNPNGICGGTSGSNCFDAPSGSCCSRYGYCGQGPDYCSAGCQIAFGDCDIALSHLVTVASSSASVNSESTPTVLPSGKTSPQGICGDLSGFNCYSNPSGTCCSSWGYCGNGSSYCDIGCQLGFGDCNLVAGISSTAISATYLDGSTTLSSSETRFDSLDRSSYADFATDIVSSTAGAGLSTRITTSTESSVSIAYTGAPMSTPNTSWTSLLAIQEPGSLTSPIWPLSSSRLVSNTQTWHTTSWSQSATGGEVTYMDSRFSGPSSISSAWSSSAYSVFSTSLVTSPSSGTALLPSASSVLDQMSISASMIGPNELLGSTLAVTAGTATSFTASSSTNALCPAKNRTMVTDPRGTQYQVGCGDDTNGSLLSVTQTSNNVTECMVTCGFTDGCMGFTWVGMLGSINGAGPGNCYLKGHLASLQFDDTGENSNTKLSGLRLIPQGQSSSSINLMSTNFSPTLDIFSSSKLTVSSPSSSTRAFILTITTTTATMTTKSTTTASSMSSSTPIDASSTSNYLVIPSPTSCSFSDPPDWDQDDSYCEIDLPRPMVMYASSDIRTFPSVNGYISLSTSSTEYEAQKFPDDSLPSSTIGPLFDDWYIYGGATPKQGIFYSVDLLGVWYEYYVARAGKMADIVHFTVRYDYESPGWFTYRYYDLSGENGESTSIGMQGVDSGGNVLGYNYDSPIGGITPGLAVRCDTTRNTCTTLV